MTVSKVKIEERRDYELHVKSLVAKMTVPNKQKSVVRKIAMQCFDDGLNFGRSNLVVEVAL